MTYNFHHMIFAWDRFPIAVLALTLTALAGIIIGPWRHNASPLFGQFIRGLLGGIGRRLDRHDRKAADLTLRGTVIIGFGLFVAALSGLLALKLAMMWRFYGMTEMILLSLTLSGGAVWRSLYRLYRALKDPKTKTPGAYLAIARSTHTDLSVADDFTITRTGMGYAARSFDKGVVAPIFWYLLAGLPGAYFYAGLSALAFRFARDGFTKGFGNLALWLETLMGFAPNLIAGVFMAIAGWFTPTGGIIRSFKGLFRPKGGAPYAEGGLPLTVMAWSLNVSLGGPVLDQDGYSLKRQWIGPAGATAQLEGGHLRRAIYISVMAYLLFMAALMAIMTALQGL